MTQLEYFLLPWYTKLIVKIVETVKGAVLGIVNFFRGIPKNVSSFFRKLGDGFKNFGKTFAEGGLRTKLSFFIMGMGNLFRGQIVRGLLFLASEVSYIWYMVTSGAGCIAGLKTLGTVRRGWYFDEELGIDVMRENGDNSMLILLYGILALFVTAVFIAVYLNNVSSAAEAEKLSKAGSKLPKFKDDVAALLDGKFHKTLLAFPIAGVLIFTIIPLVYMILLAFTNYDKDHQVPANLFTWVGLDNFKTMLGANSVLSQTFWPVLGWTLVWAVFATFLNYVFGIILAMLINKKGIRFKSFYRTLFVLAIAVPQFVSLLVMKNMLAEAGPVNVLLMELGLIDTPLPFFTDPTWARVTVILVNLWIGIPYTMLITSGILMNIPEDLYEAARIDGASPFVMFTKITMPYVLFVTTPYLITQFIGNINNFNVIYFLTGGTPATLDYYQAGKTDLLVTWLYKLTVNSRDYCYASTIGILVFVICSVISLITFRNSQSYNNEEAFQ
ncbi:MAG: carbohydrate ABC transporter permease [Huintestinicola sp.]|uniref:carbohydrate ABC transporter permease n=1 Tax=Huintestinicola sp. TaxID=2981661 RepID=UPI003F0C06C4